MNLKKQPPRKPIAIANWKMAMTVSEGLSFVKEFRAAAGDIMQLVDIVLCPPFTSIYPLRQALTGTPVGLGAQNFWAGAGMAHTGEISAQLLGDAGCKWAMLGHWEVRRRTGETDSDINVKMQAAFETGLLPILLIGEESRSRGQAEKVLEVRLPNLFEGCDPGQIARLTVIYEPEWTIGAENPAPPDYITAVCSFIRGWLGQMFGADSAQAARLVYGGSVAPVNVCRLIKSADIDGLGAGRMGRDPVAFAEIVREIAIAKGLI